VLSFSDGTAVPSRRNNPTTPMAYTRKAKCNGHAPLTGDLFLCGLAALRRISPKAIGILRDALMKEGKSFARSD
jgi:hypothetical protein